MTAIRSKEIPLRLDGALESIYAGFGLRLGGLLLDALITAPVAMVIMIMYNLGLDYVFLGLLIGVAFNVYYKIYLVQRYGGTPGRLIAGTKILRMDGEEVAYKEALLRESVSLVFFLLNFITVMLAVSIADVEHYNSLGWLEKSQYLITLKPGLFSLYMWSSNIWIWGEALLLFDSRRRAPHDYIAGTVVVKTFFIEKIRESMAVMPPTDQAVANQ